MATQLIPAGLPAGVYSLTVQTDPANGYFQGLPSPTVALIVADPTAPLWAVQYASGATSPGYSYQLPWFTFWQKVRIHNVGAAQAKNVRAYIERVPANTMIVDGEVNVGDIAPSSSAWSTDTFTLKVNLGMVSNKCDSFTWSIHYQDASGNPEDHVLTGVPQFPPGLAPGGCR